jgi:hypothetical protein
MPYTRTRRRYAPRRASEQEIRAWADEQPENAQALRVLTAANLDGRLNSFTHDIYRKLQQYGNLSERQVAAVLRGAERDAEFAARREAERIELKSVAPLAEGRRFIAGEIVSAKWKVTPYGMQAKMLVREAEGNKVWGTIPANLVPDDEELQPLVGALVSLTGTVRRADDDPHFGFFSRPQHGALGAGETQEPMPTQELPPAFQAREDEFNRCPAGHAIHPADGGFCEACAEAEMEFGPRGDQNDLTGPDFGEDL